MAPVRNLLLAITALVAFAAGAQAADLGSPRMPIAAAVVAQGFNWSGLYLGAHVGYGCGRTTPVNLLNGPFAMNTSGGLIGGQIDFNYQINQIVLGAEADLAYAGISGSRVAIAPQVLFVRTNMLGSVRARAGFAVDRALFDVTGGLGIQGGSFATSTAGIAERYTRTGWTVGAGVEYAMTPNWTVKAEYSYYDFGTRTLGPTYVGTIRADVHTVKLGVNYLFSTGPSAVVARY